MSAGETNGQIPQIDLHRFEAGEASRAEFLAELRAAAHDVGFFYVTGHDVDAPLLRDLMESARQFFSLPDDDKLAIEMVNSPHFRGYNSLMTDAASIPAVVLLPGMDGTGKLFAEFTQVLGSAVESQIVAYPKSEPLGYRELEALARAALPRDRPFVVLGESFSGPIAIRIAAKPPTGLVGVILCGTFAKNPYPLFGWAGPLAAWFPLKSLPQWVRAPLMWGSVSPDRAPEQLARAIADVSDAVIRHRIAALLAVDESEALACIQVPTLVLQAERDLVIPDSATRWIMETAAHAQLVRVDGPHLLLQTRPVECAAAVVEFVRACAPTTTSKSITSKS